MRSINKRDRRRGAARWLRPAWRGQSAVEFAIAIPVLALLLFAAADFGRVFFISIELNDAARAGAQYGSQSVVTAADSAGMEAAAAADATNLSTMTATASQCTCASDASIAACPTSYCTDSPGATYVVVQTGDTFTTEMNYPGVPHSIPLTGTAVMPVQQ